MARRFPPDVPTDLNAKKYGPLALPLARLWQAVKDMHGGDPGPHAATHKHNGGDILRLDELGDPTDNANLNATTSAHGLLRKLDGSTSNFLRGDGAWAAPSGGGGSVDDSMILLEFMVED